MTKKGLTSDLKELELEGVLYEDKDSVFNSVPSNFYIKELKEVKDDHFVACILFEDK